MTTKPKEPVAIEKTRMILMSESTREAGAIPSEDVRNAMVGSLDAYVSHINSPAYKAKAHFGDLVAGIPDMGIMQLSLLQASDLVAADMWLSGETEIEGPEADEVHRGDPVLMHLLKGLRQQLASQLEESVGNKNLKPSVIRRDLLSGKIDLERTFVEYDELCKWLNERGYHPGDWMDEYTSEEGNVYTSLVDELYAIRARYQPPTSEGHAKLQSQWRREASGDFSEISPDFEKESLNALREIVKGYSVEVARLNRELGNRVTGDEVHALTPKGRKTLHRLIVALCVEAKVNPADRGAAATLAVITQRVGLPVGDDTIRKVLAELPEPAKGR